MQNAETNMIFWHNGWKLEQQSWKRRPLLGNDLLNMSCNNRGTIGSGVLLQSMRRLYNQDQQDKQCSQELRVGS
jgi:hypothetical protein